MKDLLKKSINFSSHILFPKVCLHCRDEVLENNFFCSTCVDNFELLSSPLFFNKNNKIPLIVTFDEIGPAKTLFSEIKRETIPALLKLAASFMSYRYLKHHSLPDLIVPSFQEGSKQIEILSKEVGKILNRPMFKLFSTAKIAFWQKNLFLKKTSLQNKKVLLVTDKVDELHETEVALMLKDGFTDISILSLC